MKILKSFFLIAICFCATDLLHAQEAITTPVKPVESKPAAVVTDLSPVVQPGPTSASQAANKNVQSVPADQKKLETIKTPGKTELMQIDTKATTTLKAEPVKVQPLVMQNTNDVKPVPVTKPAVTKQQ